MAYFGSLRIYTLNDSQERNHRFCPMHGSQTKCYLMWSACLVCEPVWGQLRKFPQTSTTQANDV